MTAIDTSICVPALLADHPDHEACRRLASGASIPAHALVESYSVLTRLPGGHRLDPSIARRLLHEWFGSRSILVAPAGLQRSLVDQAEAAGVSGGATYDALVALVVKASGDELLTRDLRAVPTYEAVGVRFRTVHG